MVCVTRRYLRVFEPLVQVEQAWGLCPVSRTRPGSSVSWLRAVIEAKDAEPFEHDAAGHADASIDQYADQRRVAAVLEGWSAAGS